MPAEQQLWEGVPSLKALTLELVATLLFSITFSVAVYLSYTPVLRGIAGLSRDLAKAVAAHEGRIQLAVILAVVLVAGARIARLVWRGLVLRSQRYQLSNQRLLVETGVFSKTINEIDLRTVDDITFHQPFIERLLGLGRIGIVSSEPDPQATGHRRAGLRAQLIGVPDPRVVREQIRNAAYEATGKQVFMRPT